MTVSRYTGEMRIRPTAKSWYLLDSGPGSAAFNMALDSRLLDLAVELALAGILRFYWFARPAITLGRFQKAGVLNSSRCQADGIEIVQRPTGGRAVFHQHELTYSLIMPLENPYFGAGVTSSFQAISRVLQQGVGNLNLKAQLEKSRSGRHVGAEADCFKSAGRYELKVGSAKLLGSAQVRRNGYLLQHGSIYLRYEPGCFEPYLKAGSGGSGRTGVNYVTDLSTLLERSVDRAEVQVALIRGFKQAWDLEFATLVPPFSGLSPSQAGLAMRTQRKQNHQ